MHKTPERWRCWSADSGAARPSLAGITDHMHRYGCLEFGRFCDLVSMKRMNSARA